MIKKNTETANPILDLFPVANKKVELSFSGGRISSDGGLLLLCEVENQLGLLKRLSSCMTGL